MVMFYILESVKTKTNQPTTHTKKTKPIQNQPTNTTESRTHMHTNQNKTTQTEIVTLFLLIKILKQLENFTFPQKVMKKIEG